MTALKSLLDNSNISVISVFLNIVFFKIHFSGFPGFWYDELFDYLLVILGVKSWGSGSHLNPFGLTLFVHCSGKESGDTSLLLYSGVEVPLPHLASVEEEFSLLLGVEWEFQLPIKIPVTHPWLREGRVPCHCSSTDAIFGGGGGMALSSLGSDDRFKCPLDLCWHHPMGRLGHLVIVSWAQKSRLSTQLHWLGWGVGHSFFLLCMVE